MNNYVFSSDVFREWIQRLFGILSDATIWPLLLHCTGGKDRTGVGVALLLKNLGIPDSVIVEEYSLSDGKTYPDSLEWLLGAMPGIEYLRMRESQLLEIKKVLLHGSN
jgi:protein-tyrosine phosphatase